MIKDIIITNIETVPGKTVTEVLGIAMGNTVRAKHIGKDFIAGLKTIVGGEITQYTEMMSDARQEALNRMINNAKTMKADAVLNVRFTTSATMAGAAELLAYGTAVKLK